MEKLLALSDYDGMDEVAIWLEVMTDWGEVPPSAIAPYTILIAYCNVGSWGCDSSAWFLLRHKGSGALFEVHGSHCSCHGFGEQGYLGEGGTQWQPEPTTLAYLQSDKFCLGCGMYEPDEPACVASVDEYIGAMGIGDAEST